MEMEEGELAGEGQGNSLREDGGEGGGGGLEETEVASEGGDGGGEGDKRSDRSIRQTG